MNGKLMLYLDQFGNYFYARTVRELRGKVGITPTLGIPSQLILILLMFFGRVGGLTLIYAAISVKQNGVKLPLEKITVG